MTVFADPHLAAEPRARMLVEWRTLGVLALCYGVWGAATYFAAALGWVAYPAIAAMVALHSSLQHEALHGHPTRIRGLNHALVFPALGLMFPYLRFEATHLAHHVDPNLTDPYDDPESWYLDPRRWARLPRWKQRILTLNNTLMGRMMLGPGLGIAAFWLNDARRIWAGDRATLRAWVLHALGVAMVAAWLSAFSAIGLSYVLCAYGGLSLIAIRTFCEHRAHEWARGRSVVIESKGPLAWLFLNNNLHAVHHAHPSIPWYDLPGLYATQRERVLAMNDGYVFPSYRSVAKAYALRAKERVPHPLMPE